MRLLLDRDRRTYSNSDSCGGYYGNKEDRLSPKKIKNTAAIIKENGYKGHNLDSGSLRYKAELLDILNRTLR